MELEHIRQATVPIIAAVTENKYAIEKMAEIQNQRETTSETLQSV